MTVLQVMRSAVTNVNNYSEPGNNRLTMAKNDVSVSNNFTKQWQKGAYMRESIKRKRPNHLKSSGKRKTMQNAKTDLKILKQQGNTKRKAIQNISET